MEQREAATHTRDSRARGFFLLLRARIVSKLWPGFIPICNSPKKNALSRLV